MNPLTSAAPATSAMSAAPATSAMSATSATSATEMASESELTPLLTAWDLAHPPAADPDWRHLLDEIAHPHTTEAFRGLAATAL